MFLASKYINELVLETTIGDTFMGIFASTLRHVEEGAHFLSNVAKKTGTKLHDFYEKNKPVMAEFVEREKVALKQGAHKVKEFYDKEAPVVKQFLQEEAQLIQNKIDHKLDDAHQEYLEDRNSRHEKHVQQRKAYYATIQPAPVMVQRTNPVMVQRPTPVPHTTNVRAHERRGTDGVVAHSRKINYRNRIYGVENTMPNRCELKGIQRVVNAQKRGRSVSKPAILR